MLPSARDALAQDPARRGLCVFFPSPAHTPPTDALLPPVFCRPGTSRRAHRRRHGRLHTLFLGRRHDVVHVRSASVLSAFLRSIGANGRAFAELAAVGAHALHFGAPYGRAAAGVQRLGLLAAEQGWTLVDGRGEVWDASWATEAVGGGGDGGDGGLDDEGWDVEVVSSDDEYDYRQDDWP